MSSTSLRRSGRKRLKKKYPEDAFGGLPPSPGSENESEPSRVPHDNKVNGKFNHEQELDKEDAAVDEIPEGSDAAVSADESDGGSSFDNEHTNSPRRTKDFADADRSIPTQKRENQDVTHCRGLVEQPMKLHTKKAILTYMFGTNQRDWIPALKSRDQWICNPMLPRKGDQNGVGGMCHHFSHTEDSREMESNEGWDWYYDQGCRMLFAERQKLQILTPDEGTAYFSKPSKTSHKFLMGPYGNQQLFELPVGGSLHLSDAWKPDEASDKNVEREGWILNIGNPITCLDWATNQGGETQYLALATAQFADPANKELSKVSPAFTPSPPSRSCIQIYAFTATTAPGYNNLLHPRVPPQLRLVICNEWGDVRQMKWCHIPRQSRDEDSRGKISLGLLASVWSDGLVRVLDVQIEKSRERTTSYGRSLSPNIKKTPSTHNPSQPRSPIQ